MNRKLTCLLVVIQLIAFSTTAQKSGVPPLFQDEKVLTVLLRYPMNKVRNSTDDTVYFASVLAYKNERGGWDSLDVGLRARGNFRRKHCSLPPLRLKLKKGEAKETLFSGNKSLKVVVPCMPGKLGDQLIMKEYLCYQLYNAITPNSFNTRLADITLSNASEKQSKEYMVRGFFIEDDDLLAKRLNGKVIDSANLHPRQMRDTLALRHDFFEYMIANTDWSATFFHNVKIIETTRRKFIPVPYDFDMAGIVNAPYATFDPSLDIVSVRDRIYRGYCRSEGLTEFMRAEYLRLEPAVFEVINRFEGSFSPKELAGIKKYTGEFFTILKDDKKFKQHIVEKCNRK